MRKCQVAVCWSRRDGQGGYCEMHYRRVRLTGLVYVRCARCQVKAYGTARKNRSGVWRCGTCQAMRNREVSRASTNRYDRTPRGARYNMDRQTAKVWRVTEDRIARRQAEVEDIQARIAEARA